LLRSYVQLRGTFVSVVYFDKMKLEKNGDTFLSIAILSHAK
jgi:hypothetical protein